MQFSIDDNRDILLIPFVRYNCIYTNMNNLDLCLEVV